MDIMMQRKIASSVRREPAGGDRVTAETLWLDKERELKAVITADIGSLEIIEAYIEVLKSPEEEPGVIACPFPKGTEAFIEGKRAASAFLELPEGRAAKYLMVQCINAVIQAETYFWRERGFEDPESYNAYWDMLEENGCRMYSHPDPEDFRWLDYAPRGERKRALFHRLKNTRLMRADGKLICSGDFMDSYHEISLEMECAAESGVIEDCWIQYLRAPGKACFSNDTHGKSLIGRSLYAMTGRDAVDLAGRSEGCYHLVEILKDILMCLEDAAPSE